MELLTLVKDLLKGLPSEMVYTLAIFGGVIWFILKVATMIFNRYELMSKHYEEMSDKTSERVDGVVDNLKEANDLVNQMKMNIIIATSNAERAMINCDDKECQVGFQEIIEDLSKYAQVKGN